MRQVFLLLVLFFTDVSEITLFNLDGGFSTGRVKEREKNIFFFLRRSCSALRWPDIHSSYSGLFFLSRFLLSEASFSVGARSPLGGRLSHRVATVNLQGDVSCFNKRR